MLTTVNLNISYITGIIFCQLGLQQQNILEKQVRVIVVISNTHGKLLKQTFKLLVTIKHLKNCFRNYSCGTLACDTRD